MSLLIIAFRCDTIFSQIMSLCIINSAQSSFRELRKPPKAAYEALEKPRGLKLGALRP